MALTSYAGLVAALGVWIDKSPGGVVYDQIPDAIKLCEAKVLRGAEGKGLRVSRMIQRVTATIGTDNRFSSVPDNYLEPIVYELSDGASSWELDPTPIEIIASYRRHNNSAGRPKFYGVSGTASGREFEHYPAPDQSYSGSLAFYAKPTPLSPSNATNWVLEEAPDAYLYGSLIALSELELNLTVQPTWKTGFLEALVGLEKAERTKAGKLRTSLPGLVGRQCFDITRG